MVIMYNIYTRTHITVLNYQIVLIVRLHYTTVEVNNVTLLLCSRGSSMARRAL